MKRIFLFSLLGILFIILILLSINVFIEYTSKDQIFSSNHSPSAYTAIVFGAAVYKNQYLSDILKDRALTASELYKSGKIQKILVSGDNSDFYYNEVVPTQKFLITDGVPKENIVLDYAGFDTYDTLYRAREIFGVQDTVLITQEFHLPRALFICRHLHMECHGVIADKQHYLHAGRYERREFFAKIKAFFEVYFHAQPKFLGEKIDIYQNPKNGVLVPEEILQSQQ